MHGQQTLKYLNDKAVADAILAKKPNHDGLSAAQAKDFADALAKKAQEKAAK
jgi:hypothetical protein